jgi:hypothetical protein
MARAMFRAMDVSPRDGVVTWEEWRCAPRLLGRK